MRHRAGFTLIELMIVIAIIAIIAAIAIPNLLEARKGSNEASAIQALRAVHAAQTLYHDRDKDRDGIEDYSDSWGELATAGVINLERDPTNPGSCLVSGYEIGLIAPAAPATLREGWRAVAAPVKPGRTGDRFFYIDESGTIRYATTGDVPPDAGPDNLPDFMQWRAIGG